MTDKPPFIEGFDEAMAAMTAYVDDDCLAMHMEVTFKKEKLVELLKKKSKVYDRIKEIHSMYNMPIDWMKRLPASVLREPIAPSNHDGDASINYFDLRSKLSKEYKESANELEKLESEIGRRRFELVLAQIDCLQKKLDVPEEK